MDGSMPLDAAPVAKKTTVRTVGAGSKLPKKALVAKVHKPAGPTAAVVGAATGASSSAVTDTTSPAVDADVHDMDSENMLNALMGGATGVVGGGGADAMDEDAKEEDTSSAIAANGVLAHEMNYDDASAVTVTDPIPEATAASAVDAAVSKASMHIVTASQTEASDFVFPVVRYVIEQVNDLVHRSAHMAPYADKTNDAFVHAMTRLRTIGHGTTVSFVKGTELRINGSFLSAASETMNRVADMDHLQTSDSHKWSTAASDIVAQMIDNWSFTSKIYPTHSVLHEYIVTIHALIGQSAT